MNESISLSQRDIGIRILLSLVALGILFAGPLSRLSAMGWLMYAGFVSIAMFLPFHLLLHGVYCTARYRYSIRDYLLVVASHLLYLGLFLFQTDFGDDKRVIILHDLFGWPFTRSFYDAAWWIWLADAVLYLAVFFLVLVRMRRLASRFSRMKFWLLTGVALFLLTWPVVAFVVFVKR